MGTLFAADALLPSGWSRDVMLEWDAHGTLTRVQAGAKREGAKASGLLMPGMANVHSHAFQRAMAGLAETRGHPTDDFWTWREEMYRLVARLAPQDVEAIARHLYVELLEHGYTSVGEFHYLHRDEHGREYAQRTEMCDRIVAAAGASGIALTLLPVLYAYGGFGHKPLAPAQKRFAGDVAFVIDMVRELADFHLPNPLLRLGIAPHSVRAVDALMLTELAAEALRLDPSLPIHMHVSEQSAEVFECQDTHGTTPLDWVADLVAIDARWTFVHATHLTQLEMRRLGDTGARVALCPVTECNLGDGIFDFAPWFEGDRPWCVGGDSHVSVSPFQELRALEYSQRLRRRVRNVAATEQFPDVAANLWSGAARDGAAALAQPSGALAAGSRADMVVLDVGDPDHEGLDAHASFGMAMFGPRGERVRDVYVAGRQVVSEGIHAGRDEAQAGFRASLARLRAAS